MRKLLVIKLSALGDFVSSFRSFDAIRQHFPDAEITLLTTRTFQRLAVASKWFNRVWVDERPAIGQMHQLFSLRARMIAADFDLVIDLQNTERSSLYYHMLFPRQPLWSGVAQGCAHRYTRRDQRRNHAIDREAVQLGQLGLSPLERPNLEWLNKAFGSKNHRITPQTLLLAPGYAPALKKSTWPVHTYAEAVNRLVKCGWQVVLTGTKEDIPHNRRIRKLCTEVRDLTDQVNLLELAVLGQQAGYAFGNDNGIMRLLANCGCRSVMIQRTQQNSSIPPTAQHVKTLQHEDIRFIELEDVLKIFGNPAKA